MSRTLPIDVDGRLTAVVDGVRLQVDGVGPELTVRSEDAGGVIDAVRRLRRHAVQLDRLHDLLTLADVRLVLLRGERRLGAIGAGSRPTALGRLLGARHLELRPLRGVTSRRS